VAHIAGEVHIDAPIEAVFDVVADTRNEPAYNPDMTRVELLTPEPIGTGTRFRASMGRAGTPMLVELTEVQRPRLLASHITSSQMEVSGTLTLTEDAGGTTMRWNWQVRPKGGLRLLGPLFGVVGGRMERRIWTGLKRYVESGRAG
jgi:uncharacterized protein YndB with AHSA1/START domain